MRCASRSRCFAISAVTWCGVAACEQRYPERIAELGRQAGIENLQFRRAAQEAFLAVERGSLASEVPVDAVGRRRVLASLLNAYAGELGADEGTASLTFGQAEAESEILLDDGRDVRLVFVQPMLDGVPIIDRVQSGVFARTSGALTAVLASLTGLATPPRGPATDSATLARSRAALNEFLARRSGSFDSAAFRAVPVISATLRRSGFLYEQRVAHRDGSLTWLRLLVDPSDGSVHVLSERQIDVVQAAPRTEGR